MIIKLALNHPSSLPTRPTSTKTYFGLTDWDKGKHSQANLYAGLWMQHVSTEKFNRTGLLCFERFFGFIGIVLLYCSRTASMLFEQWGLGATAKENFYFLSQLYLMVEASLDYPVKSSFHTYFCPEYFPHKDATIQYGSFTTIKYGDVFLFCYRVSNHPILKPHNCL